jgi:hypothetical protein
MHLPAMALELISIFHLCQVIGDTLGWSLTFQQKVNNMNKPLEENTALRH